MKLHASLRTFVLGVCTSLLLGAMLPAQAADPAPTGTSAGPLKLTQAESHNAAPMWRNVRRGDAGITTIKGAETGVLVQSEGNAWRHLRNGPVTLIGGILLLVVAGLIGAYYAWKGQLRLSSPPTGRKIPRFTLAERVVHYIVAGCFVLLAAGGLMMVFGKHILVPVLGHTVFSLLMQLLKPVHNFLGLVFAAALLVMIVMWAKDNIWDRFDAEWIRRVGGLLDQSHVPSGRFNFGEKAWFWFGVTLLGLIVSASGFLLDFPGILELRASLQTTNLVHGIGALLLTTMALGHIYIGTIGVEGALDAMKTGEVDEVWAKDHHAAWFEQVATKDKRA